MEGNPSLSCHFVITVQVYIYFPPPEKQLFQVITHRCFTNLFLKNPKELNYISILVCVYSTTIRFPNFQHVPVLNVLTIRKFFTQSATQTAFFFAVIVSRVHEELLVPFLPAATHFKMNHIFS